MQSAYLDRLVTCIVCGGCPLTFRYLHDSRLQASQHSVITSLTSKNSRLVHQLEGMKQKKQRLQARLKLLHASIGADSTSKGKQGQYKDSDDESQHSDLVSITILSSSCVFLPQGLGKTFVIVLLCRSNDGCL